MEYFALGDRYTARFTKIYLQPDRFRGRLPRGCRFRSRLYKSFGVSRPVRFLRQTCNLFETRRLNDAANPRYVRNGGRCRILFACSRIARRSVYDRRLLCSGERFRLLVGERYAVRNLQAFFVEKINNFPVNPRSIEGYTLVNLHPWSRDYSDAVEMYQNLDDDVEIVTAEQFFQLIRENVPHVNVSLKG